MLLAILVLFGTVLGAGWGAGQVPAAQGGRWLKPLLAFSGAYLFTLTVTHLLPEAWQLLLEVLSQGVEHGHVHVHHEPVSGAGKAPYALVGALVLHSFLEGSILVRNPAAGTVSENFYAIVGGVALHHIPAAFALSTLLRLRLGSFGRVWPWLLVFALASPAGILVSNYVVLGELLRGGLYAALLGLVAGNFLHVSTTILFETSPEHRLNWAKLAATLAGLTMALLVA